ncbi:MAG: aminotransferase class I/II-fold pyridoxal phosphate-dependent enzyme [Candidatus Eremiobacteraeota bacterium]|nr:aminotransferase class I/II-fold pyridoxal phosphate-dependent enzyme [Candidatus Eremiobacteraeota bacterium]
MLVVRNATALPNAPFDRAIDSTVLRRRTSQKWAKYPPAVLPLFIAETDFPVPPAVARVLHRAIDDGDLGYAEPRELGTAYAAFAGERYGCPTDPADVYALPDVMVGVAEILRVVTGPGEGVVINPPVYPPFFTTIRETGRTIVEIPLDTRGPLAQLDFESIERAFAAGARAYVFCNPHNPVGRAFSFEDVTRVAALAERYGVVVLADEIHGPLVLPGAKHVAFESVTGGTGVRSITLTSASKGWNIAGLKCALAVSGSKWGRGVRARLPKALHERTGHLGVLASVAALGSERDFLDRVVAHLNVQRDTLRRLLDDYELGAIRYSPPEAGFLAWLDCRDLDLGVDPAKIFLKFGEVALVPGPAFGREGSGHARFNFGTSTALVHEGVRRMRRAVNAFHAGDVGN